MLVSQAGSLYLMTTMKFENADNDYIITKIYNLSINTKIIDNFYQDIL